MLLRLIIQFILFLFPDILIISIVTVSIFPSCANSWQTKISLLGPSSHWEPRQTESWTPIAQAIIGVTSMLHSLPQTLFDRPLYQTLILRWKTCFLLCTKRFQWVNRLWQRICGFFGGRGVWWGVMGEGGIVRHIIPKNSYEEERTPQPPMGTSLLPKWAAVVYWRSCIVFSSIKMLLARGLV